MENIYVQIQECFTDCFYSIPINILIHMSSFENEVMRITLIGSI